jgi:hypothetical protein
VRNRLDHFKACRNCGVSLEEEFKKWENRDFAKDIWKYCVGLGAFGGALCGCGYGAFVMKHADRTSEVISGAVLGAIVGWVAGKILDSIYRSVTGCGK